jgi:alpha-glucoside transport system permease protein
MGAILTGLLTVVVGVGGLALVLSLLYWLTHFLPSRWQESGRVLVFVGPAVALVSIGLVVPAVRTIITSFFDDNGDAFVGLDNYVDIFGNEGTRQTFFNSLTWVLMGTTATVIIGLAVARFADNVKGEKAIKSLIFIPGAISLVGAGTIWLFVYAAPPFKVGLLNSVTGNIPGLPESMGGNGDRIWVLETGFGPLEPPTASAPGFNTFLLIVIFIWASTGFATVVFSAAIKGVPESLIEAAKVDGATNRQAFYKVTLPYIRATIITVATTTTIGALKAFDIVAAMTGGRFGTSTLANEFYVTRFVQFREGPASALAVLIFILVVPVVVMNRRSQRRAEEMMAG